MLFLGHQISGHSISPDPKKIVADREWSPLSSVKEVRQFLGFANYFRRFIDHYSTISRPLEEIKGKQARFEWSLTRQRALLSAPVLQLANVTKPFRVETDASDFAIAGVLLQEGDKENEWHPVGYAS